MLFYLIIGFLFQLIGVQCISGDEMIDGAESEDIEDGAVWPKNELEYIAPKDYSDLSIRAWLEMKRAESDLLNSPNIPKEIPDLQNLFLEVKSYTDIPVENGTIDLQNFLNEIESKKIAPVKTVTFDIQKLFDELESSTDYRERYGIYTDIPEEIKEFNGPNIKNIQYEIESDKDLPVETVTIVFSDDILNEHYSSVYTTRKIAGLIGFIITLILAPFIIHKKCKAQKDLKLRVFVISSKSERREPLLNV